MKSFFSILLLLSTFLGLVVAQNGDNKVAVCFRQRYTKMVRPKKAEKLIRKGRAVRGSCEESFVAVCRKGRKTLFVEKEKLQESLDKGLTEGRCQCDDDVKECPDGSVVSRDWKRKCKFAACPEKSPRPRIEDPTCPEDERECPKGFMVGRNVNDNCNFYPCPCSRDLNTCPDGSLVGRDGNNNCEFEPCPKLAAELCLSDVKECPDGSSVGRNPKNKCKFHACPESRLETCCRPEDKPKCPSAACCPKTGRWSCPIGRSLRYPCGDEVIFSGFGPTCEETKCCDPSDRPSCRGEGSACCNGEWVCSIGDGKTFRCQGENVHRKKLTGNKMCERKNCCEESARPFCSGDKAGCCPDGQWTCNVVGNIFDCDEDGILGSEDLGETCPK